jgi:hypothetical protein
MLIVTKPYQGNYLLPEYTRIHEVWIASESWVRQLMPANIDATVYFGRPNFFFILGSELHIRPVPTEKYDLRIVIE